MLSTAPVSQATRGTPARETLTPRARWLAALRHRPVDRLPFWPKLNDAYQRAQAAPFNAKSVAELHAYIGSDPHVWTGGILSTRRTKTETVTESDGAARRTRFRTPVGDLERIERFDERSRSWHPVRFPVRNRQEIRILTAFYEDAVPELDKAALEKVRASVAELGEGALTAASIGESPLMEFVEWLAGVENAHLLLADEAEDVEALFDAMHRVLLRRTELMAAHCPTDVLYLVENTSTTLISPTQYRTFNLPHLRAYSELTRAAGRLLVFHMCGHLKKLLPDLAKLPVDAFEAFTSPTVGNTTLLDGRTGCPDKTLIGGTNATLWLEPADTIAARIERDLDELPHHRGIVITSAGVMPPFCTPQTIRAVCDRVKAYPART